MIGFLVGGLVTSAKVISAVKIGKRNISSEETQGLGGGIVDWQMWNVR